MPNKAEIWKIRAWDKMELMHGDFNTHVFPWHSHETYCISLIERGVECGALLNNTFTAGAGAIVLINPNEVHHNKPYHASGYSIRTFYINAEVLQHFALSSKLKDGIVNFNESVIYNPRLFSSLLALHKKFALSNLTASTQSEFGRSVSYLIHEYGGVFTEKQDLVQDDVFDDITAYIIKHIEEKIVLDYLAQSFKLNKFQFIRLFKKKFGVTPFEFILLKRVEAAKQKLQDGTPLVQTALDTGFYDQSHFTNYFKKYVGVTPLSYQKGCNILQDQAIAGC